MYEMENKQVIVTRENSHKESGYLGFFDVDFLIVLSFLASYFFKRPTTPFRTLSQSKSHNPRTVPIFVGPSL